MRVFLTSETTSMKTFNKELISKLSTIPTPYYFYNMEVLKANLVSIKKEADKYNYHIHYALKANSNSKILKTIKEAGIGADCVSGQEVLTAIENGFAPNNIMFAGVGKSDREIIAGLDNDIACFNCESLQEIEVINELANKRNKTAHIALRINPNVSAKTHHYITTGLEENKFGINEWELDSVIEKLRTLNNIKLIGLHFHIGSQITDLSVFGNLCNRVNNFQKYFKQKDIHIQHLNVGGGLGVDYHHPDEQAITNFEAYFEIFKRFLEHDKNQSVHFEIGRALVAQCGSLISKVLYIKNGIKTNFAILDAGMTELIRPALYQSYHKIENLSKQELSESIKYDVVGPICESSDCFGKAVDLPETFRGDLFAIRTAGAYGEVMSSSYNLRQRFPAIYSDELD
jgi:diaminopimelate decarboxylase